VVQLQLYGVSCKKEEKEEVFLDSHLIFFNSPISTKANIENTLKGPKHEIFESGFFTQIRRLWLGDLGTGEKN
jgi:hypothetical protein